MVLMCHIIIIFIDFQTRQDSILIFPEKKRTNYHLASKEVVKSEIISSTAIIRGSYIKRNFVKKAHVAI